MKAAVLGIIDASGPKSQETREKDIASIGQTIDLDALLRRGADLGWSKIAVILSIPKSLWDDAL